MPPVRQFQTTQRNLPHWKQPGATYFLTWRVTNGRALEPEDRALALRAILFWDNKRWHVYAAAIMPDHAHALVRPLPCDANDPAPTALYDLSELLKGVKGYSSRVINSRQQRSGTLWQDESYDRIVRDDREFEEMWTYILYNPVKTGLSETPELYPWLYQAGRAD